MRQPVFLRMNDYNSEPHRHDSLYHGCFLFSIPDPPDDTIKVFIPPKMFHSLPKGEYPFILLF